MTGGRVSARCSYRFSALLLGLLVLHAPGCSSKPDLTNLSGTVTYQKRPMKPGFIYFLGPDSRMGMGAIGDDGSYVATDVPVGEVKVAFKVASADFPKELLGFETSGLVFTISGRTTSLDIDVP
jgi:hypothetical protein